MDGVDWHKERVSECGWVGVCERERERERELSKAGLSCPAPSNVIPFKGRSC